MVIPFTSNSDSVRPMLSVVLLVMLTLAPAAACAGALREITGNAVSSLRLTVVLVPELPARSVAIAVMVFCPSDRPRLRLKVKPNTWAGELFMVTDVTGSFTAPLVPKAGMTVTVRYEGLPGNPAVSVRFK